MPPPPATPSPHRFVVKKKSPVRKTPLAQEQRPRPRPRPRPTVNRFNATPRFTFSQQTAPRLSQATATPSASRYSVSASDYAPRAAPSASRYLTPATRPTLSHDAIDSFSSDLGHDVHDSIENDAGGVDDFQCGSADEHSDAEDRYPAERTTTKRRRLSSSLPPFQREAEFTKTENACDESRSGDELVDEPVSSLPILSSPPAPTRRNVLSTPAKRFRSRQPIPWSTPVPIETFLRPPRFRSPDPAQAEEAPGDPLPEHFSPHRKGQKYIPGGLAAEVRDWLVSIESTVPSAVKFKNEENWVVVLVVDEVKGGRAGMSLILGRKPDGEAVKVVLAGEGQGSGLQKGERVTVGRTVGIKGPVWEIVVEWERWGVGVDWKVLSS